MDLWLAPQCDWMLAIRGSQLQCTPSDILHQLAHFGSAPTPDGSNHHRRSGQWRRRSGRKSEAKKLEYENDAIGIDPNLVAPTGDNPAGWFASYHAYPYYPDFMMLDPEYRGLDRPKASRAISGTCGN